MDWFLFPSLHLLSFPSFYSKFVLYFLTFFFKVIFHSFITRVKTDTFYTIYSFPGAGTS